MASIFSQNGILYPVLVHLTLVAVLFLMVSYKRMAAVKAHIVENADFAHKGREPEQSRRWANNLGNQFELPILFYALIAMLFAKGQVDLVQIVLAWLFAIGRLIHSVVQVSGDNVGLRGKVFVINFVALGIMWLYFLYLNLVSIA